MLALDGCGCPLLRGAAVVRGEDFSEENVNQAPLPLQLGCSETRRPQSLMGLVVPVTLSGRPRVVPASPHSLQAWVGPGGKRALEGLGAVMPEEGAPPLGSQP